MKKLISIILALTLVLPCVSLFALDAFAKDNYDKYKDLFEQRNKYLAEDDYRYKFNEYFFSYPYHRATLLTVLLYTEKAKNWTYEYIDEFDDYFGTLFVDRDSYTDFYVSCKEFDDAYADARKGLKGIEPIPALYVCVEKFGITKSELIEANRKMKEEPDSIRNLFPFLTDDQFESARHENGLFCFEPLEDYMIEALYIKDKFIAYNLLADSFAVYVPEYNSAVSIESEAIYTHDFWNDYATCDLTSQIYGDFFEYCEALSWNIPEIPDMKAEREKQLANPKTGEPVYLIHVAIASLTLGVYAVYPRKKRKLEA